MRLRHPADLAPRATRGVHLTRVLVIYCHPNATSFASALHRAVKEGLTTAGHAVTDLDLYAEGFKPVLTAREHIEYSDSASYYKLVEKYARQLAEAEAIVAVYPTWWYGMPAMLKGYFDGVWAPGIAFDVTRDSGVDTSRLNHIRRLGVVTTYGSPWWLIRLWLGDPDRKLWGRAIRKLRAHGCSLDWRVQYNMDSATPDRLDPFLTRVCETFAGW
jgi:NAD(P)H dehydrogenase (quinone)